MAKLELIARDTHIDVYLNDELIGEIMQRPMRLHRGKRLGIEIRLCWFFKVEGKLEWIPSNKDGWTSARNDLLVFWATQD